MGRTMKTASLHAANEISSGCPVPSDERRGLLFRAAFRFRAFVCQDGWIRRMRRSNDGSRTVQLAAALLAVPDSSHSLLSPSVCLTLREGSYLPRFDPRGVYDLPVQPFFRRFLTRASRDTSLVAGAFIALYRRAGRGVPSDALITGSELHPGSLEQDLPCPVRTRAREGGRGPAGISFRHLVGRGRATSRWSETDKPRYVLKVFPPAASDRGNAPAIDRRAASSRASERADRPTDALIAARKRRPSRNQSANLRPNLCFTRQPGHLASWCGSFPNSSVVDRPDRTKIFESPNASARRISDP